MSNDTATVWGGQIRLGRSPVSNELLVGDSSGNFALTPASAISPSIQTQLDGISNVQGTILYRSASAWTGLAPGTAGQVLSTGGVGADPFWVAQTAPYTPTWTEVVATSDTNVANTTLASAAGLLFAASAGIYYSFEFGIIMSVVTSSGLKIAIAAPGGSLRWAPGNSNTVGGTTSNASVIVIPTTSAANTYATTILGYFNCTSPGNVQLQFAQQAAQASAVTVYKGSWLRYRTV